MLALLPGFTFLSVWLLLGNLHPGWGWRRSLLRAAMFVAGYSVLITELLGLFEAITPLSLALAWATPLAAVVGWRIRRVQPRASLALPHLPRPLGLLEWVQVAGIAGVLTVTALVAWFAPPNTWDSLNYHMARVAHWAQNQSIRPYATGIEVQNGIGPFAEIGVLQLYVLSGGDRLANFVEWSAMLGSLVGVSLIAKELGRSRPRQLLSAVLTVTLPMGIAQASSTMTDYVVAFWLICVAAETLSLWKGIGQGEPAIFAGLAAGLAIGTKPTSYAFLLPFGVWVAAGVVRRYGIRMALRRAVLASGLILALNAGHMSRNLGLYGNPLGVSGLLSVHANRLPTVPGLISNLLRHAGLQAGTPWPEMNALIFRVIVKLHLVLGLDLNDPRTTFPGEFWRVGLPSRSEVVAGNWLHAWLYLITLVIGIIRWRKQRPELFIYGGTVLTTVLVYSFVFKWQSFSPRHHLVFFALYAPVAATLLAAVLPRRLSSFLGVAFLAASWPWLVGVIERPLLPDREASEIRSVLVEPRPRLYFGNTPSLADVYADVATRVVEAGCTRVGIMLSGAAAEYPFWVYLGAPSPALQIEWIVAGTPSARYSEPAFSPCAIICDITCPMEWLEARGLPLHTERSGYRLYMTAWDTPEL